jgi:hypothetical protein
LALRYADLHDGFALAQEFQCIRERAGQDGPETRVRHVSTAKPQDLRRCAEPVHEIDEVLVLREHDDLCLSSLVENLWIFCSSQTQIANV